MPDHESAQILAEERRAFILDLLDRNGKVLAAELSRRFAVSDDTTRRDLDSLATAGHLRRVHGGALRPTTGGAGFAERNSDIVLAQTRSDLARATVALIRPGS